jgi:hypothetical protein
LTRLTRLSLLDEIVSIDEKAQVDEVRFFKGMGRMLAIMMAG